jgi:hypothetical protein
MEKFLSTKEIARKILDIVHEKLGVVSIPIEFDCPKDTSKEGTYVFSENNIYHYMFIEKGKIRFDNKYTSLFDISYIVLKDVISPIAKDYEFKNRNDKQDFRRIWFSKELDLWTLFGEDFYERAKQEMDEILLNHPYIDE